MAKYCTNCGKELTEGSAFCTVCGAQVETDGSPAPETAAPAAEAPKATPTPAPAPTYAQPAAPAAAKPVKTSWYFWMMLVFSLPLVGLIMLFVVAFSSDDPSKRGFARAYLIWLLVAVVLAVILCGLFIWLGSMLVRRLSEPGGPMDGLFRQFGGDVDVDDLLRQYGIEGDLDDLLKQYGGELPYLEGFRKGMTTVS